MLNLLSGIRRQGGVVNLPAAGVANAVVVMAESVFASMVGNKTQVLKRIKIRSNGVGADTWVHIGTGVGGAFIDRIPALRLVNNTTDDYVEGDIPESEFAASITAYPEAVGAGSIDIQVEVDERG